MALTKTPEQVAKMREAGILLSECLNMLVAACVPGSNGKQIDTLAEEFILDHGAVPAFKNYGGNANIIKFPASICFSRNNTLVHGIPAETDVIEERDIITIDCGLSIDGWFSDAARLFGVGEISKEDQNLIDSTSKVLDVGIAACVAGNKLGDVCNALQAEIGRTPYYNVLQYVGHAIGEQMHEAPPVPNYGRKGIGPTLKPGMVFCLEPMLKKTDAKLGVLPDGWTVVTMDSTRAAHIEHMVLITDNKPEILTA